MFVFIYTRTLCLNAFAEQMRLNATYGIEYGHMDLRTNAMRSKEIRFFEIERQLGFPAAQLSDPVED